MRIPPATRRSIPPCGYAHRHPRPPRCVRCSGRIVFRGVAHQSYRRRWAVPHERPRVGTGHHLSVRAGPHAADAQPSCLEAAGTRFLTGPSADGTPPHGARARGWRSGPLLVPLPTHKIPEGAVCCPASPKTQGTKNRSRRARLLSASLESHQCSTGSALRTPSPKQDALHDRFAVQRPGGSPRNGHPARRRPPPRCRSVSMIIRNRGNLSRRKRSEDCSTWDECSCGSKTFAVVARLAAARSCLACSMADVAPTIRLRTTLRREQTNLGSTPTRVLPLATKPSHGARQAARSTRHLVSTRRSELLVNNGLELWEVVLHDLPHPCEINLFVNMRGDVAKTVDTPPRNCRMTAFE